MNINIPGPTPAINKSPTDEPVTTAYIIIEILGGIRRAIIAELIISAELAPSLYPSCKSLPLIGFPTATTVACVEPEIAPKIVHVAAVVMAIPP